MASGFDSLDNPARYRLRFVAVRVTVKFTPPSIIE
jgi:hypothetical protein